MSTTVPLNPNVPPAGERVEVEVSTERWSEFTLADKSVLRAKVSIIAAIRIPDQFDATGKPVYAIEASVTSVLVSAPEELIKKA